MRCSKLPSIGRWGFRTFFRVWLALFFELRSVRGPPLWRLLEGRVELGRPRLFLPRRLGTLLLALLHWRQSGQTEPSKWRERDKFPSVDDKRPALLFAK